MNLYDFLLMWHQKAGSKIKSNNFLVPGVWSTRLRELPEDQLKAVLISIIRMRGGSIEPFGDLNVLSFVKKWFSQSKTPSRKLIPPPLAKPQSTRLIEQRRKNGDL